MSRPQKRPSAEVRRLDKAFDRIEVSTALAIRAHEFDEGSEKRLAYDDLAKLLLSNGDSAKMRISTLARQCGLPYKEVVMAWRDYQRLEGIVEVASRVPQVMAGIAQDALPQELTCTVCKGTGRVTTAADDKGLPIETEMCIPCEGVGKVRKPGDPIARKQVLEMMELVGPKALPIMPITGSNVVIAGGSLEDTLRAARGNGNGSYRDAGGSQADERPAGTIDASDGAGAL